MASRGKGLGGSSAVNALHFTRGNREDFDNIKALGNEGWGFQDVLKYFKKSENNHDFPKDTTYHGVGGPQVHRVESKCIISTRVVCFSVRA